MGYAAPTSTMLALMRDLCGLDEMLAWPAFAEVSPALVEAVLNEGARFASTTLAPLNHSGDREGATLRDGAVATPRGFPAAWRAFAEGGWVGAAASPAWGGQALPTLVGVALAEMWKASNHAFSLCGMLTQGAN